MCVYCRRKASCKFRVTLNVDGGKSGRQNEAVTGQGLAHKLPEPGKEQSRISVLVGKDPSPAKNLISDA